MRRPLSLLLLPLLCGCVGYPKFYWRTLKGTARVEDDGKPVTIKAAVIKECESVEGEAEFPGRERETKTDAKGNYKLGIHSVVWHWKNLFNDKNCNSRLIC